MCAGDATAVVTTGCFRSSSELLHVLGAEDTAAGLGTEDKAARSGVLRRCGVGVHRTADALQALKRVLLWIVSGHFVDDFFGVDIDELADGAFDGMAGFLDLISEAGQGAHHPGRTVVDLSRRAGAAAHSGEDPEDPGHHRRRSGQGRPGTPRRLNFVPQSTFGAIGKAALQPRYARAHDAAATSDTRLWLGLWAALTSLQSLLSTIQP